MSVNIADKIECK